MLLSRSSSSSVTRYTGRMLNRAGNGRVAGITGSITATTQAWLFISQTAEQSKHKNTRYRYTGKMSAEMENKKIFIQNIQIYLLPIHLDNCRLINRVVNSGYCIYCPTHLKAYSFENSKRTIHDASIYRTWQWVTKHGCCQLLIRFHRTFDWL